MSIRLLILDDEEEIVEILSETLRFDRGYSVRGFTKAEDALQSLQSERYDVIISDIRMPKIDGIEFLRQAKAILKVPTPFILLTGFTDITMEEALMAGASCVLNKPWVYEQLLLEIEKAVST